MKLNGWHRTGIVLSFMWMLLVAASGFDSTNYTFTGTVMTWFQLPDDAFVQHETHPSSTTHEVDCNGLNYEPAHLASRGWTRAEAVSKFEEYIFIVTGQDARVKADKSTLPKVLEETARRYGCRQATIYTAATLERRFGMIGITKYGFGGVLFGWLIAYLALFTYRWIAAGFNANTRTK